MMAFCLIILSIPSASGATSPNSATRHIGVLILGAADYKTARYYRELKGKLNPDNNPSFIIEAGDEIQSKYMTYWAKKGFLKEQPVSKQDMIDFAASSGYDKVLYLVPNNFFVSDQMFYAKTFWQALLVGDFEYSTASIAIFAVLCDKDEITKQYTASYEFNTLKSDDKSSLKKQAFNHCIKEIGKEFSNDL